MKPTQNFRLSATTKYLLSTITNAEDRHIFRHNMIQAQLMSEVKPTKEKDEKKK